MMNFCGECIAFDMETTFFDLLYSFENCTNSVCGWSWANAGFLYSSTADILLCAVCHIELSSNTTQCPRDVNHQPNCCHRTDEDEE